MEVKTTLLQTKGESDLQQHTCSRMSCRLSFRSTCSSASSCFLIIFSVVTCVSQQAEEVLNLLGS